VAAVNARELARVALQPSWSLRDCMAEAAAGDVAEAIAGYEAGLLPLSALDPCLAEPRKRSDAARAVCTALRPTGAKLAPHLSPAQADAWIDGVLLSLSKWPPRVAAAAARAAVHEPFRFIGDVDAKLHELAATIDRKHRNALFRLRRLAEEIERAANPPPRLEAPEEETQPWPIEEARRLNPSLLAIGLRQGFIAEDVHDRVIAERRAVAAIGMLARALAETAA
jgi:hypothetical protein